MTWEGTGPMATPSNTTTFPGFTGHFIGKPREAVATGTVVVDGETLVDGSTTKPRFRRSKTRTSLTCRRSRPAVTQSLVVATHAPRRA